MSSEQRQIVPFVIAENSKRLSEHHDQHESGVTIVFVTLSVVELKMLALAT